MSGTGFAYPNLFGKKVPPPAARWAGNAKFNFIGGHNDRTLIPVEALIEATASVLRREGQDLALYGLGLGLARRYGVPIFEDECYSDLIWGGINAPPALYSLDPSHVIHIGSFSKTLSPALRLGYVVCHWDFMSRMIAIKTERFSHTGALEQMVVAEYFSAHFQDHVDELSQQLKGKLDTMVEAVEREFGTSCEPWLPKGG